MSEPSSNQQLTESLEDYLETIYELVRDQRIARVRDIAKARGVRPGSVSPAMRRLADLGLIEYERREYIVLTPKGEEEARRVLARHDLLSRLFSEILSMPKEAAEADACAMEHNLSDMAMDRLVRFFEFFALCPEAESLLTRFHDCALVHTDKTACPAHCDMDEAGAGANAMRLSDVSPGGKVTVTQVFGHDDVRKRLLSMGLIPGVTLEVDRLCAQECRIGLNGFGLSLSPAEAERVFVSPATHD